VVAGAQASFWPAAFCISLVLVTKCSKWLQYHADASGDAKLACCEWQERRFLSTACNKIAPASGAPSFPRPLPAAEICDPQEKLLSS
jgi:hypothetical protein